jgi:exopolysaccharide biosynthesis WecB/TagA/CpsF family protein
MDKTSQFEFRGSLNWTLTEPQEGLSASKARLAIIIATRDREAELQRCLESLANQVDPPPFQLIIVDDGSKQPPSQESLARFGFPETAITKQNQLGIASARNRGVWFAQAEWIVFIDDDCVLAPHTLRSLDSQMTSNKDSVAFQLELLGGHSTLTHNMEEARLVGIQSAMKNGDGTIDYLNTSGFAIRRDYAHSNYPLFNANFIRSSDTGLLAKLNADGITPRFAEGAIVNHNPSLDLLPYIKKHFRIGVHSIPAMRVLRAGTKGPGRKGRQNVMAAMRTHAKANGMPWSTIPCITFGYALERLGRTWGKFSTITPGRKKVLGCPVDAIREEEVVERFTTSMRRGRGLRATYLHAWSLTQSRRNPKFIDALNQFDILIPDGMGVVLCLFLRHGTRSRKVTANDFFSRLLGICAADGYKVALVGGEPHVAERGADILRTDHPDLSITHVANGYMSDHEQKAFLEQLQNDPPDLIALAAGQPAQELLAIEWSKALPKTTFICVGGLFDYIVGTNVTPPQWIRRSGFEWLVRLATHPVRNFRRYVLGIPYLLIILSLDMLSAVGRRVSAT